MLAKRSFEGETMDKTFDLACEEDEVMLPGFRFHPTDEELVNFYLRRKVESRALAFDLISEIDIYKFDPWDLPKLAPLGESQQEWYFFCPRDRKYRNSTRPNRVTLSGFWKATGTDRPIYSIDASSCIGLKKSLVFYQGKAAKGVKTDWMMHEFRLPTPGDNTTNISKLLEQKVSSEWAICRIFKRKSNGPKTQTHITEAETFSGERKPSVSVARPIPFTKNVVFSDRTATEEYSEEDRKSQSSSPVSTLASNSPSASTSCSNLPSTHKSELMPTSHGCFTRVDSLASCSSHKPLPLQVGTGSAFGAQTTEDFWSSILLSPTDYSSKRPFTWESRYPFDHRSTAEQASCEEETQLPSNDCWPLRDGIFSPKGSQFWDQSDLSSIYA